MESPNQTEPTQPNKPEINEGARSPVPPTQEKKQFSADEIDALFKTQPVKSSPKSETEGAFAKNKKSRSARIGWIIGGIVLVLLSAGLSAYLGYQNAIQQRIDRQAGQVLFTAGEQFNLALADMQGKQWDRARTRLEYVIQLDPSFPGAGNKLKEVLIAQIQIATPTMAPTATETSIPGTATPDLRGAQDYLNQINQYITAKDWEKAVNGVYQLRQENKSFHTVEVDGLLYIALRNRGVDKILQKGQLEQGMYDLSLAEAISPLDADSASYRTWGSLYLSGASYWGVNWQRVVDAFSQIYPSLPMLRDGNGFTAQERFRIASVMLADQMAAAGDYCKAQPHYDAALALSKDAKVEAASTINQNKCADSQKVAVTQTPIFTIPPTLTVINTNPAPTATTQPVNPVETATPQPPAPSATVMAPTTAVPPTSTNTQAPPAPPTSTQAPPSPTPTK